MSDGTRQPAVPAARADHAAVAGAARGGAGFTMIAQVIVLCVTFGGTFILANLLPPASFGLVGIVTAATGAGDLLRDAGLANAAIQARRLSNQQRSNLFWTSAALGSTVALAVYLLAPLLGGVYGNADIVPITQAIAVSFLINGLASQHRASLSRDLRLRITSMIDALASVMSTVTAIAIAALTHSVWALVFQQLAGPIIALTLALCLARWRPMLPRRSEGIAPMLSYGFHQLGAQLAVYIGENIDTLVAGYRFSATDVGYYSRAYSLVTRPLTQVNVPAGKLANPVLSRFQDDDEQYYRYLLRAQRLLLVVTATVIMLFAAIVAPIIALLLGDTWLPIVPLIQILAIGALFRVAAFSTAWIAASRGLNKISLYANLTGLPVTIGAILLGSQWGITGIAVGQAVSGLTSWILGLLWFAYKARTPSKRLFANSLELLATLVVPFSGGLVAVALTEENGPWVSILAGAGAFMMLFALEVMAVKRLRADVGTVMGIVVSRGGPSHRR